MFKKLSFVIAAALTTATAYAAFSLGSLGLVPPSMTAQLPAAGVETASIQPQLPALEQLSPTVANAVRDVKVLSLADAEQVPYETSETALLDVKAQLSTTALPAKAPSRAPGTVVTGTLYSKDLNYKGQMYHSPLTLYKAETGDNDYCIVNVYSNGDTINATIDAATGTVVIPYQKLTTVSQGDIMICAMTIEGGNIYFTRDDVVGTIDANGVIKLGAWGLVITEGANAGAGYNFFVQSEWVPTNASARAYNVVSGAYVNYDCLVEQNTENSLTFYGLSGTGAGEVLNARITSSHQVQIPNSFVYSNMMYGDFYIYPYDVETGKAVVGQNLVGRESGQVIDFEGWAVASRAYPTMYVGYKFTDIKLTLNTPVSFPAATQFNADGEGTPESPYIINTVEQFQALASVVADGMDFDGDCFALGADLDFSSLNELSFQPVGSTDTPFNGVFDGAGHTVSGLTVSSYSFTDLGLFGAIGANGVVKNLNISGFRLASSGTDLGVVAGRLEGRIENVNVTSSQIVANCELAGGIAGMSIGGVIDGCQFQGGATSVGSVAGIVGQAVDSRITGCQVRANITHAGFLDAASRDAAGVAGAIQRTVVDNCSSSGVINDTKGYACTGGLTGRLLSGSTLSNSFSAISITATANSTMGNTSGTAYNCYQGGLTGYASEGDGVRDCFASCYIVQPASAAKEFAGGLVGYLAVRYAFSTATGQTMDGITPFVNCYFSGQVYSGKPDGHKNIFGSTYHYSSWYGELPENIAFVNCYYDNQVAMTSGDKWGRPTDFFTTGLPDGFAADKWSSTTGLYPVLTAKAALQASKLASVPMTLAAGQNVNKVSKNFTLGQASDIAWGIYTNDGLVNSVPALSISGSQAVVGSDYANLLLAATSADGWGLKLYRVAIVPKVFDGEGTPDDPFQIKSADDFIKLDNAVSKYGQGHTGDYFKVMNDIDFSGSAFGGVSAGSSIKFDGVLDGNNAILKNLVINNLVLNDDNTINTGSSKDYTGLFADIGEHGVVKNLKFDKTCSFTGLNYVGSVAAVSLGRIEGCRSYADVTGAQSCVGGIVGSSLLGTVIEGDDYSGAVVSGCYYSGSVNGRTSCIGGIVGQNTQFVELCQNDGKVRGSDCGVAEETAPQRNGIGGIVGYNSNGTVDRSLNNGYVYGSYGVGGIVGSVYGESVVTGSVNTAYVKTATDDARRGAIIGLLNSTKSAANNYYDASLCYYGGVNNAGLLGVNGLSSSALASGVAPEGLSADDYDFAEGKYPVLKQFVDEPAAQAFRSFVAFFADGDNISNVIKPVTLAQGPTWSMGIGSNPSFVIADNTLSVQFPDAVTVPTGTVNVSSNFCFKSFPVTAIPVILQGEGTEESPYLIETPDDWNKLSDFMFVNKYEYGGKYFRVTADLDFKGDSIRLLAVNGVKFNGVFDGAGHTVKGYVYNNTNTTTTSSKWVGPNLYRGTNIGLFGTVGADGVVKNLKSDGNFAAYQYIAGIAGEVYGALINCEHAGVIANNSAANCSGIANKLWSGGRIIDCVNSGSVTAKTTNASGIVNTTVAGSTVSGCVNKGTVQSTTTAASGIVYKAGGLVEKCVNEGAVKGTGTLVGICNTLDKTGCLEYCYNTSDIKLGEAGTGVAGVLYTNTANTDLLDDYVSWIKGCYNTGNLSAKTNVFGVVQAIKAGFLMEDCYNTGRVETVTTFGAYGVTGAVASNNAAGKLYTVIRRCWNGGDVSSFTASSSAASGLFKNLPAGTKVSDCYNIGNVTVQSPATASGVLCTAAGVACQVSGATMTRCWNAGEISAPAPSVAGIAGYVAGDALVEECFNLGDITGSSINGTTELNTNGTAGGLIGYISTGAPIIRSCYNAGTITGDKRVGGLAGGMFRPDAQVIDCYNSGKVVCTNPSKQWWSGTIYTGLVSYTSGGVTTPYFANSSNVYYDKTVCPGTQYRDFAGSGKTTDQMSKLKLGDAFHCWSVYPMLKSFGDTEHVGEFEASRVSTSLILLSDGDTHDAVTGPVRLCCDALVNWTTTGAGRFEIINGVAYPRQTGEVKLTASNPDNTLKRSFALNINGTVTGIDDLEADGKTIVSTLYVDMAGRIVPAPVAGQPYVVKVTYDDGSTLVRKVVD